MADPVTLEAHALDLLIQLIRIDTTNPPGGERPAAELCAREFAAAGIPAELLEMAPYRSNVVARLAGTGGGAPLLLAAHLDVVPAAMKDGWKHHPFAAVIDNGYLFGRGTIDMKNMAAMSVATMCAIARAGIKPRRDIIFAGVADEEVGCDHGSKFLVEQHPDKVRAEYCLGEVGGFSVNMPGSDRTLYPIQIAEKGICWFVLRARGTAGHGSIPREDNAPARLGAAVARLGRTRLPHRVTPVVERYVAELARAQSRVRGTVLKGLLSPRLANYVLKALPNASMRRVFQAVLANTVSPTVLRAGSKTNVIPATAEAEFDGRTLPGQTAQDLIREVRAALGPEFADLEIEILREHGPSVTEPHASPLFDAIGATLKQHDPQATPIPYMIPGFTDASQWNRLGIRCYGFSPVRFDAKDDVQFGDLYHGVNERISVDGFKWGARVLHDLVKSFCA